MGYLPGMGLKNSLQYSPFEFLRFHIYEILEEYPVFQSGDEC
jgi:hypothetical protein